MSCCNTPFKCKTTYCPTCKHPIDQQPIIWVLGGPGSGKATQCQKLVGQFGFTHLSAGDLLRAEVKKGSERGNSVALLIEQGELVPNELVLDLLWEAMGKTLPTSNGYVIAGYPREKSQGIAFEKKITTPSLVLYFEASDEVLTDRLLKRAAESSRPDDKAQVIKHRLGVFHANIDSVLSQYRKKLVTINAERSIDAIYADVQKAVATVYPPVTTEKHEHHH